MDKQLVLLLLLAVPLVGAANGNLTSQYLSASAQQVKCKADFMAGVISGITTNVPGSDSLGSYATSLQNDQSKLQDYANTGDVESYRTYLHGTFDPDMRAARDAVVSWRADGARNATAAERLAVRNAYSNLRPAYDSCESGAVKSYGDAKVNGYNQILSDAQARADNLSAKGIDTSALSGLISDAKSQIVSPLQAALASATGPQGVADAVRSYCLYNGCKNGTNFHFAAKWNVAKLKAIEGKVQAQPNAGNYTEQLTQVTDDLTSAGAMLEAVGTSDYAPGQQAQVWDPIKDAASVLTQVIHGMRS